MKNVRKIASLAVALLRDQPSYTPGTNVARVAPTTPGGRTPVAIGVPAAGTSR